MKKRRKVIEITPDIVEIVLSRVSMGETLRSLAKELGFDEGTFRLRVVKEPELRTRYKTSREMQAEAWSDQIIELADTVKIGQKTKQLADGGIEISTGDMVERSRLQIDTRKWLMMRLHPAVYGEKVEQQITGKDGLGPATFTIHLDRVTADEPNATR
jgi:hypothetical protein